MSAILILGGKGRLGAALSQKWAPYHTVTSLARPVLDVADLPALEKLLESASFDWLVNCTAITNVDLCESETEQAEVVNALAPKIMARAASKKSARLIHFSTDYVFDGKKTTPYTEEDEARPLSVYGHTKLTGEQNVLSDSLRHIVARVSWVFGPEKPSFVDMIIARAKTNDHVEAIGDKTSCPTYAEDVADFLSPFLTSDLPGGLYHTCNSDACTWQAYGQFTLDCAVRAGIPLMTTHVGSLSLADMKQFVAARPAHTAMSTSKLTATTGHPCRNWQEALAEYISTHYKP